MMYALSIPCRLVPSSPSTFADRNAWPLVAETVKEMLHALLLA